MRTICLPSLVAAFFGALVDVWSVLELRSEEILELPFPKITKNTPGHIRTLRETTPIENQHISLKKQKSEQDKKKNMQLSKLLLILSTLTHLYIYDALYTIQKTVYQHIILCQECTNKKKECVMFKRNECRTESPNPNTKNARHSFSVHHKLRITNQMPPRDSPQWQG